MNVVGYRVSQGAACGVHGATDHALCPVESVDGAAGNYYLLRERWAREGRKPRLCLDFPINNG